MFDICEKTESEMLQVFVLLKYIVYWFQLSDLSQGKKESQATHR